jgi:hypothetical protein
MTNQCTQFWATGWGSTIERANDFVSGGKFFQERGIEKFFPPARIITYWIGILPPSLKAVDESSIFSPPDAGVREKLQKIMKARMKKFLGQFSMADFPVHTSIFYQIRPEKMNGGHYVFFGIKLRSFRFKG